MEMQRPLLALPLVVSALIALAPAPPASGAASSMRLGFLDGAFSDTASQTSRFAEAAGVGSRVARVPSGWAGIARTRPTSPTDPGDPAYDWTGTDRAVRASVAAGVEPLLSLTQAPAWAEGAGRPADLQSLPGSWRPDPTAYGQFAVALARRYDGTYPDPLRPGAALPRVRAFIPWNEPNLQLYLAPQWRKTNGRFVTDAPRHYRRLVRAFHDGIHRSQPSAQVVAGAMAPFGDPQPGGRRIAPARFLRDMLCLSPKLRRVSCGSAGTPRFDVLSHHPYSVGGPFRKALNPDDVSVPDVGAKLVKPLRRAERLGLLGSKKTRRVWVTEMSWDSRPGDPLGVPERTQADWLAQALYVLARQGVDTVTWFQVRDTPARTAAERASSNQSGVLLADGRRKLSATAFGFPFVAVRPGRRTTVWALAPQSGPLAIERRVGGRWQPVVRRSAVPRGGVVQRTFSGLPRGTKLRARSGERTSLTVTVSRGG